MVGESKKMVGATRNRWEMKMEYFVGGDWWKGNGQEMETNGSMWKWIQEIGPCGKAHTHLVTENSCWFGNLKIFRKACCQRWSHQLFVYIHVLSIYYMIWSNIMFFLVHAQAFSSRNAKRLVVGVQRAIFPQMHYLVSNNIGLLLSIHKPFLVEMELRMVNHPNSNQIIPARDPKQCAGVEG